jgi:hypothetical protein
MEDLQMIGRRNMLCGMHVHVELPDPKLNADLDAVARAIAVENKWRAQRHGVHGTFVCDGGAISVPALVDLGSKKRGRMRPRSAAALSSNVAAPSPALAPPRTRSSRRTCRGEQ